MQNKLKLLGLLMLILPIFTLSAQQTDFKKSLKINGRIQYDYEFLKRSNSDQWLNGSEFRRIHLSAAGFVSPSFKYKVEFDFSTGKIGFRYVYIKYVNPKIGSIAIGSIPEPTGLAMLTSSNYLAFLERPMLTSLQNFRWGSGFLYENYNLLEGKVGLQMSLTNNGTNTQGFKDVNLEVGENFTARLFYRPYSDNSTHTFLHIGLNYAQRPYQDLKFRPENHLGDKYHYFFADATDRQIYGFELAATYQSFYIQSEYKSLEAVNSIDKNYNLQSYYIGTGYFLTGEHRPYKNGAFRRVKPIKDIDHGGLGAFELAFRYSNMTVSNDVLNINPIMPSQIDNFTFGLNWYLTSHVRLMYNYVLTNDQNNMLGDLNGHLFRLQLDF